MKPRALTHRVTLAPLYLELPDGVLECQVLRSAGRRPALRVRPDRHVELRVPRGVDLAATRAWARTRAPWVARTLMRLTDEPPELAFTNGAAHQLRGRTLTLALHRGPTRVWSKDAVLHVQLPDPTQAQAVQRVLTDHYRTLADAVLPERLAQLARELPWRCPTPEVRLRLMRRRWGSCRHDGLITLSTLLMRASPACVDYVAIHELCHLREFHHGPAFYSLLERALPNWLGARQRLEALPPWPALAMADSGAV